MSGQRTRLDDSIGDIGLGAVVMLAALIFGLPPTGVLLSEFYRSNRLEFGFAVPAVGGVLLAVFGIRLLARGFAGLFSR